MRDRPVFRRRSRGPGATSVSRRVVLGAWLACSFFAAAAVTIGGFGVVGVRAATNLGHSLSSDQLATTNFDAQLEQALAAARSGSQEMMYASSTQDRATVSDALFNSSFPAIEARLADLANAHAGDGAVEHSQIADLTTQWRSVRLQVGRAVSRLTDQPNPAAAVEIGKAFDQLDQKAAVLLEREQVQVSTSSSSAFSAGARWAWTIGFTVGIAVLGSLLCGLIASRRIRAALQPAEEQIKFADTLQMAENEQEAHVVLKRHLERSLGEDSVTVLSRNNSADRLEAVTAVPDGSALLRTLQHARPGSCLAIRAGRQNVEDDTRVSLLACPVCSPCPGQSTCHPLTVGGVVIGCVLVNRLTRLDADQRQRLRESVAQAAPVLANLRNLAIAEVRAATDALTALPNKRTVSDTLMRMLAQASRALTPLSLLTLDLDHFKQVNDRFGHPVGDQALAGVGAALRSVLRAGDFAGRNGGEEFSVMLPGTDASGARVTAEKIRTAIAGIVLPGIDLALTVSIGIAAYPEHALTTERLERLADSALYVAKRSGRNRVEVATSAVAVTAVEAGSSVGAGATSVPG